MAKQNAVEPGQDVLKSIAFPFQRGGKSFPAEAQGNVAIHASLRALVLTGKNERVMDNDYGVRAHDYVFDDISELTMALLAADIKRSIAEFEPRVTVLSIVPSKEQSQRDPSKTTIAVHIEYAIGNQAFAQQIPVNPASMNG